MRYFMKALQIMGLVSTWSVTALEDGKVTVSEGTALIEGICKTEPRIIVMSITIAISKWTPLSNIPVTIVQHIAHVIIIPPF